MVKRFSLPIGGYVNTDLALVTYTFNDARLADGLLRGIAAWQVLPRRIIVIDDGSTKEYQAPRDLSAALPPVEVHRLAKNLGPTGAKSYGLTLASSSLYVLSVDCDVRLPAKWSSRALEILKIPQVALVGGVILCDSGVGPTARYMAENNILDYDPERTGFLSGNVWLMKGRVWEEVGGFGEHNAPTHEDFIFCRRLLEAGHQLRRVTEPPVRQIRCMSRRAYAAQNACYSALSVKTVIERHGLWKGIGPILELMTNRMAHAVKQGEDVFIYLELLQFSRLMLELFALGTRFAPQGASGAAGFRVALHRMFQAYPQVLECIDADLEDAPKGGELKGRELWEAMLGVFDPLMKAGVFDRLEAEGVKALTDEDATSDFDFHYLEGCTAKRTDVGQK